MIPVTATDRLLLTVACTYCAAQVGDWCVTVRELRAGMAPGHPAANLHGARRNRVRAERGPKALTRAWDRDEKARVAS